MLRDFVKKEVAGKDADFESKKISAGFKKNRQFRRLIRIHCENFSGGSDVTRRDEH